VLHRGFSCSLSWAMDGRIMRHGIIMSCQSAATSKIVKALLDLNCPVKAEIYSKLPDVTLYLYIRSSGLSHAINRKPRLKIRKISKLANTEILPMEFARFF